MIIEKTIGRYLNKKEVIHHIDKNKLNNNRNNLKLYISNKEHLLDNHLKRDRYGKFKKN